VDTHVLFFRRLPTEEQGPFGRRLRSLAEQVATDPRAATVIVHVDDGETGAPEEAAEAAARFAGSLTVAGLPSGELPAADAVYRVSRRVMKRGPRPAEGKRTYGFTIVCPIRRAPSLTREQFDDHWRANHAPIHIRSSPATRHYEQLPVDAALTESAPELDGVGWLSFASASAYAEKMFDGPEGRRAIYEDIPRFLEPSFPDNFAASEFVFRDEDRATELTADAGTQVDAT
jgi:uncharacterized protein (TIGR02118 family)